MRECRKRNKFIACSKMGTRWFPIENKSCEQLLTFISDNHYYIPSHYHLVLQGCKHTEGLVAIVVENQNCPKIKNSTYCNINNTQTLVQIEKEEESREEAHHCPCQSVHRGTYALPYKDVIGRIKRVIFHTQKEGERTAQLLNLFSRLLYTTDREGVVYLVDCKKVTTRNLFSVLHDVLPFEAFHLYFYIQSRATSRTARQRHLVVAKCN